MIIPTLNEAENLGPTLRRLREAPTAHSFEVIVSDGGSTDRTTEIARRLGARVITGTRGRARQMNAGAAAARGDYLYFLHADTLPPVNWQQILQSAPPLPCCLRLRFDGPPNSWLSLFGYLSRFNVDAFRYGDQSLFVSREAFRDVNGFRDELSLFEDYDLARRLKCHLGGIHILPAEVLTSARKYRRHGVLTTQFTFILLYLGYRLGLGQQTLLRIYGRRFGRS